MKWVDIMDHFSKEMWARVFLMAKKEYKQLFRNRWIVVISGLFMILTVLVSHYGTISGDSREWNDLENTVRYLTAYIEYMVPIFALILGYGSVVRERERGTMELILSYPLDRGEVIAGKFLGLWGVLCTCVIAGLGLGGFVISRQVENVVWSEFYLFILAAVLLGGVYISITMLLSIIFDSSNYAMSGSIFVLFLFSFIWLFSMVALAELTFGWKQVEAGNPPRWYFGIQFFNPVLIWYTLLALNIPALREWAMEFGGEEPGYHPEYYDTWIMIALLLVWIAVPLLVGEYIFKRQEGG